VPPADNVVIVGGGLAAVRTARALRGLGYRGRVTLFSEEEELPYDRPPLSKSYLLDPAGHDGIRLLGEDAYRELDISVELGQRVVALDTRARWVVLEAGDTVPYDVAVIATGARARRLAAIDGFPNVLTLRTASDARTIAGELAGRARVAVVGGGFIGLEVAATARSRGNDVTVVEREAFPLAAVLGPELGAWVRDWHEEHGVKFRCGAAVLGADGGERARRLLLEDGTEVPADVVVVGVGIERATGWLEGSGIEIDGGVLCDDCGRTSHGWVYAVGDVASRRTGSRPVTSEHWTSATEQALRAAGAMVGRPPAGPPRNESYFWSDQYGRRLQFAGETTPDATITIESGSLVARRFVAFCRDGDRVTGILAVDSPREFVAGRAVLSG
jgi:3-phenylpropionate/trans-cinnamate dioxygenase ferredoxin reductase subunit